MKRFLKILGRPEFPVLLFFFALFLFVLPFQRSVELGYPSAIFTYLFLAWILIIVLLFLMSREIDSSEEDTSEDPR